MAESNTPLLRPLPQRAFGLEPSPSSSSHEPSPADSPAPLAAPPAAAPSSSTENPDAPPHRTRSVLNLTASTLFGIYAPSTNDVDASSRDDASPTTTSPGTPALLPKRPASTVEDKKPPPTGPCSPSPLPHGRHDPGHHDGRGSVVKARDIFFRGVTLYLLGVLYGGLVVRLHDRPAVAPVKVAGIDHRGGAYVTFWGMAGVVLGHLLPWLDRWYARKAESPSEEKANGRPRVASEKGELGPMREERRAVGRHSEGRTGGDWITSVRSVGVFVGIAFAIVGLPISLSTYPCALNFWLPMIIPKNYRFDEPILTLTPVATTALAVHAASFAHPGPRQPHALVPPRPHAHRLWARRDRGRRRDEHSAGVRPRHCAASR